MGVHSTIYVSRKAVENAIREYLNKASNEELECALFAMWHGRLFYNYKIDAAGEDDNLLELDE